jgi:hypothetical protein
VDFKGDVEGFFASFFGSLDIRFRSPGCRENGSVAVFLDPVSIDLDPCSFVVFAGFAVGLDPWRGPVHGPDGVRPGRLVPNPNPNPMRLGFIPLIPNPNPLGFRFRFGLRKGSN